MIFRLLGGCVSVMLICDLGDKKMSSSTVVGGHPLVRISQHRFSWVSTPYRVATEDHLTLDSLVDDLFFEEPTSHLLLWGGLAIFASLTGYDR